MTIELAAANSRYRNDGTITDAPAVRISGAGVTFTNGDSGRVNAADGDHAAIVATGAGATIVNELGGIIRGTSAFQTVIRGPDSGMTIDNGGLIAGSVRLGDGDDRYIEHGAGSGSHVDLGGGADSYDVAAGGGTGYPDVDGGDGIDTVTVHGGAGIGGGVVNFEHMILLGVSGNLFGANGYRTISLDGGTSANFLSSISRDVVIAMAADTALGISVGAIFGTVAGGDGHQDVSLWNSGALLGGATLGAGDDTFRIQIFDNGGAAPVIGGTVDGGGGHDTLSLGIDDGSTLDLAPFVDFETLSAGGDTSISSRVRVIHANGFANIIADPDHTASLTIAETDAPTTNAYTDSSTLILEATARIGSIGAPDLGFGIPDYAGIGQGTGIVSVIANQGIVIGDVRIGLGDDVYNGTLGSVGGTIYGYAGNDSLFGGAGSDRIDGGFGGDLIVGGAGADTLTGGPGADIFRGTTSDLAGDRITDLAAGDRIDLTDAAPATLDYTLHDHRLDLGGAVVDLGGADVRLVLAEDGVGGTDLIAANSYNGINDFDGNGHSDLLWRNVDGALTSWGFSGSGDTLHATAAGLIGAAPPSWSIVDTFDFNGDGLSDLLWREAHGAVAVWTATGDGGFDAGAYYRAEPVPTEWRIAGTGNIDGDGRDDVLWQYADGRIAAWTPTGDGGFAGVPNAYPAVGADWKVEGLADFNGDGFDDILWRNTNGDVSTWLNDGHGAFAGSYYHAGVPTGWHIQGAADFTGDGKADLLWRNDDGAVATWQSTGTGFDGGYAAAGVPTGWHIAQAADLDDDGRADIVWRNDDGAVATWHSNGAGFDGGLAYAAPTDWSIIAHQFA